jgi:hypothetical protein
VQGALLRGTGNGAFVSAQTTNPLVGFTTNPPPANLWSNISAGDFFGSGNLDLLYSVSGLPLPAGGSGVGAGLYMQLGRGDGTFGVANAVANSSNGIPATNDLYGASVVGLLDGDGMADIASIDRGYDDTFLGQGSTGPLNPGSFSLGLNQPDNRNSLFNQVAAGFFKIGRTKNQDLVFQEGASFIPYLNSGDGIHFTPKTALTGPAAPLYPTTVLLSDVDSDGNGDLVVVYYNTSPNPIGAGPVAPYQVYIWWGNGDGTFNASPLVLNLGRNYYLGAVADLNGDGRPDLVAVGRATHNVKIYWNEHK